MTVLTVAGRLVLEDRVVAGRLTIEDGWIVGVDLGGVDVAGVDVGGVDVESPAADAGRSGPLLCPGFVDIHVHGWGGHDAMGGPAALDGMARSLLRRGVTSFLPTAVSAPLAALERFAAEVRSWTARAPVDGAEPLGFNLEGPFLARTRHGAHDPRHLREPASIAPAWLEPLFEGLRVVTVAPELPGALDLIRQLRVRGVASSLGHSEATADQASAGIAAGATSTTHLFNAMRGLDHRSPGLALAALLADEVAVELIADGIHVAPGLWPLIARLKPVDRLLLVSDALPIAGTGDGRGRIGGLEVEVLGDRATIAGTATLAGSVIALDSGVRNLVAAGTPLPAAVAAATRNPLALLGIEDRGRLAPGQRADLVELDDDLAVRRVMRAGTWFAGPAVG